MNKAGIIEILSQVAGTTKKDAEVQLKNVLETFKQALKEDGKVSLVGDLTMEIKETKPSSGTMKGKEWSKPAGQTVKCKLAKGFIEEVVGE